jgi:uncharacterized protein DUF222
MRRMTGHATIEGVLIDWALARPVASPRLPVDLLSKVQKAAELQWVVEQRAMLAAYEAELVLGLAEDTPDSLDPPAGTSGARKGSWASDRELPGVSEFFVPELAAVLNCGRGTADHLAVRAWAWRENLPGTLAALAAGELDEARAKALADVLGTAAPATARAVEDRLLGEATGLSVGLLRRRAEAALIELDPDAVARNKDEAEKRADVRRYPSPREGMTTLAADLPADEAAACYAVVDALAVLAKQEGDSRPIGQLRAAMLSALIRQPGDPARPAVTAVLHVSASLATLAGRSTAPGEVDGVPLTGAHLRALLEQLDALCPGGLQEPAGGELVLSVTDGDGRLLASMTRAELERLVRRGCRVHPDADCGCPLLDRPPPVDRYEPSAAQRTWVETRDRTCRFPNCGRRAGWADLDHVVPHGCGGRTECGNLCCLCRSHHRLKTFAPGWRFEMTADGVLSVTTPSGVTRTTWPPGLRPPDEQPDPAAPAPPDDPAPF